MYEITTEKFSGPLDLLLQLVEKRNLEITEISLSQVTQDYLNYVCDKTLIHPEELADFLIIASTLLLIKSKCLLPTLELEPEEQEEILDLENRLHLYKIYKQQGIRIQELWNKHLYLFTRPAWKDIGIKFSPPPDFSVFHLSQSFKQVLEFFKEETPIEQKKITKIVTLKQRIQELIQKLTQQKIYNLEELVSDKKKKEDRKIDLILIFLAVLYLAKENIIKIKQERNFGSIWISKK